MKTPPKNVLRRNVEKSSRKRGPSIALGAIACQTWAHDDGRLARRPFTRTPACVTTEAPRFGAIVSSKSS